MNFLAHAYLSFDHPEILVGNMISDFVKGKKQFGYEPLILAGITLHRRIDTFTDLHPATKQAMEVFRTDYRLYSGAIVDVVYDHFLANDSNAFPGEKLFSFTAGVYETLEKFSPILPQRFLTMLPYMKTQNWLYNYKSLEGTAKSMQGLVKRAAYLSDHEKAFELFNQHYAELEDCYNNFIGDVKNFTKQELNLLLS